MVGYMHYGNYTSHTRDIIRMEFDIANSERLWRLSNLGDLCWDRYLCWHSRDFICAYGNKERGGINARFSDNYVNYWMCCAIWRVGLLRFKGDQKKGKERYNYQN